LKNRDQIGETMVIEESEKDMRGELGLSKERSDELMRITDSIISTNASNGKGRTSHVLLSISGRKDLTDTEKVVCTFIFACGGNAEPIDRKRRYNSTKFDAKLDLPEMIRNNVDCVVIAPDEMEKGDILAMIMAMLMSQIKDMPYSVMKKFCKDVSILFAKIAETGDFRYWNIYKEK
jgi:hypothetical protein